MYDGSYTYAFTSFQYGLGSDICQVRQRFDAFLKDSDNYKNSDQNEPKAGQAEKTGRVRELPCPLMVHLFGVFLMGEFIHEVTTFPMADFINEVTTFYCLDTSWGYFV